MKILVLNSGSSTLKYQLFDVEGDKYNVIAKGNAERIGIPGSFVGIKYANGEKRTVDVNLPTHNEALREVFALLLDGVIESLDEIKAVGHRVVHGGETFKKSTLVDEKVIKEIEDLSILAPLHNPAAVLGIRAVQKALPQTPQVVTFDTAFHQTMPKKAFLYGLPLEQYTQHKIRKYGAHGTSHQYVAEEAAKILGRKGKFITCHIGSGASISAVDNGVCVDTSMGFTPLGGIIMGTRTGDMDPYIPLHIMKYQNKTADEVNTLMNKQSGMQGLAGYSDMRDVEAEYLKGNPRAIDALEAYVYTITKFIGSYIAAMGGVDAIIFTAGVGENSPIVRSKVLNNLKYLGIEIDDEKNNIRGEQNMITTPNSKVKAFVIPTNEELVIARDTKNLVTKELNNKVA
ncbi:MAG: acetate kinase [Alphaproteobacteria bacterium]|nr:acetate kinase [Alphaproteobacteria bacterium]